MVGVPGRSKGCNTCRKRRIRCTLERPQCAQCLKSNRICAGYQRERIFITGPKILTNNASGKGAAIVLTARKKSTPSAPTSDRNSPAGTIECTPPGSSLTKQVPPSSAFRHLFFNEFICSWIPDAERDAQSRKPLEEMAWLMRLPELSTRTRALEASSLALCLARVGRQSDDIVLVKESMAFYGEGLRELQKALWDPKLMYRDETLAACMLLSMYEVLECPADSWVGWVTHSDGCERLVQLRGPQAHISTFGHQLFLSARFNLTMKALSVHGSTYLSDPEWNELPWQGSSKSLFDRLLDLLMTSTQVYEQAFALGDSFESLSSFSKLLEIVERCWGIDAELQQFSKEIEDTTFGPHYWPEFSTKTNPADDPELGKVFPIAFRFVSLKMAHTCMLYWTLSIMLWSGLTFLYKVLASIQAAIDAATKSADGCSDTASADHSASSRSSTPFSMARLPSLSHRTDIMPLVRNICQSLEYCMQDEMRATGPLAITFPLQTVLENLRERYSDSRELVWVKAAMENISQRGYRISKYLDQLS